MHTTCHRYVISYVYITVITPLIMGARMDYVITVTRYAHSQQLGKLNNIKVLEAIIFIRNKKHLK